MARQKFLSGFKIQLRLWRAERVDFGGRGDKFLAVLYSDEGKMVEKSQDVGIGGCYG